MKIAVSSEKKYVSGHFGHCEGFTIYNVEGEKIMDKTFTKNPGHKPGFLPKFLKDLNVEVIISGGMGETAQSLFRENNIKVVVGAEGVCDQVVKDFINGNLLSTGSICDKHAYEGHCNE